MAPRVARAEHDRHRGHRPATGRFARSYHTIYDGIVGPWFLPTFAAAAGLAELDYVVLLPSARVCEARVTSRTGHSFDDLPATRKMHDEFAAASIGSRHLISDAAGGPEEIADQVEEARRASLLHWRAGVPE